MPGRHGVGGGEEGASRAMMKLVGAAILCFLATTVGDLPHECACLECGNYFRRHLFLVIFPPRTFSRLICSGSIHKDTL